MNQIIISEDKILNEKEIVLINEMGHIWVEAMRILSTNEFKKKINYITAFSQGEENKKDDKTNYGYYINHHMAPLIDLIKHLKIKSIFDLGIGCGMGLSALRYYFRQDLKIGGVDINKHAVEIARQILYPYQYINDAPIYNKDIFKLTASNIRNYKCLYFWDPFIGMEIINKFINHLSKIGHKNQFIIAKSMTTSYELFSKINNGKITNIEIVGQYSSYTIFRHI